MKCEARNPGTQLRGPLLKGTMLRMGFPDFAVLHPGYFLFCPWPDGYGVGNEVELLCSASSSHSVNSVIAISAGVLFCILFALFAVFALGKKNLGLK